MGVGTAATGADVKVGLGVGVEVGVTVGTDVGGIRPFQENESLIDGLQAAVKASSSGESIACSGLTLDHGAARSSQTHHSPPRRLGIDPASKLFA